MKGNYRSLEYSPRSLEDFSGYFYYFSIKMYLFVMLGKNMYLCRAKSPKRFSWLPNMPKRLNRVAIPPPGPDQPHLRAAIARRRPC